MKNILIFTLIFALFSAVTVFGASSFDKDIVVLDQSRNDKVTAVFKEMIDSYREKDVRGFFGHISEDRFVQDYMTFHEAILQDMRTQDILSVDTWINKISADGIKRYLYVRWEKRYEDNASDKEIRQLGSSRFLFDEIDGEYKLVEIAGNNFWGGSLPEWRAEVPPISGQEKETVVKTGGVLLLPDLVISGAQCNYPATKTITFTIFNSGSGSANAPIAYKQIFSNGAPGIEGAYDGTIPSSGSITLTTSSNCENITGPDSIAVDPNNLIPEANETNNTTGF